MTRRISIRALLAEGDSTPVPELSPTRYFNPRPPCGGRHDGRVYRVADAHFNPRPPCGGRRRSQRGHERMELISIRALLAEGDYAQSESGRDGDISIRALLAEGDSATTAYDLLDAVFQSAPSLRRATENRYKLRYVALHFNPRPPCGGRPATL